MNPADLPGPKPTFLLIGAPKAATTNIAFALSTHPDICLAYGKEVHYFSRPVIFAKGWEWYRSRFAHYKGEKAIGDASTSYSRTGLFPHVVDRILEYLPDVKILYSVRHPLERMESTYVEFMATKDQAHLYTSVNDAVRSNDSVVGTSMYWRHISEYRKRIPDDRIKIIWFEEYIVDPHPILADVCRFLGVNPMVQLQPNSVPKASRAGRLQRIEVLGRTDKPIDTVWERQTRQWVIDRIKDDAAKFLAWGGRPPDYWRLDPLENTRPSPPQAAP